MTLAEYTPDAIADALGAGPFALRPMLRALDGVRLLLCPSFHREVLIDLTVTPARPQVPSVAKSLRRPATVCVRCPPGQLWHSGMTAPVATDIAHGTLDPAAVDAVLARVPAALADFGASEMTVLDGCGLQLA